LEAVSNLSSNALSSNPLLNFSRGIPNYPAIKPADIEPAIALLLQQAEADTREWGLFKKIF